MTYTCTYLDHDDAVEISIRDMSHGCNRLIYASALMDLALDDLLINYYVHDGVLSARVSLYGTSYIAFCNRFRFSLARARDLFRANALNYAVDVGYAKLD